MKKKKNVRLNLNNNWQPVAAILSISSHKALSMTITIPKENVVSSTLL